MKPQSKSVFYVLFVLILLCSTFAVLEIVSRVITGFLFQDVSKQIQQHQAILLRSQTEKPQFEPHPYLAYTPTDVELTNDGCIIDGKRFTINKPDNTLRVACLGGSTTKNAYTKWLEEPLQICFPGQKIEMMDWGCQGWTMAESTINYLIRAQDYSPDVVILHHGINDLAPRVRKDFVPDYSHYRHPFSYQGLSILDRIAAYSVFVAWGELLLGIRPGDLNTWTVNPNPGPVSHYPGENTVMLYRNGIETIASIAAATGSKFIAAGMAYNIESDLNERNRQLLQEHNRITLETAEKRSFTYLDMQSVLQHYPEWFLDQCHLRNHGNKLKAQWLANAVAESLGQTPTLTVSHLDQPEPAIRVQWNFPSNSYDSVEVYVQVNDEKPQFLFSTTAGQTQWVWQDIHSGKLRTLGGMPLAPLPIYPQSGNIYRFLVWRISNGLQVDGPAVQAVVIRL